MGVERTCVQSCCHSLSWRCSLWDLSLLMPPRPRKRWNLSMIVRKTILPSKGKELDKMDSNKDGKANLAEISAYMKKEFYGPEDIKEDKLTPAQVDEKSAADAKEYLEELDKNKDTFLDLSEFTAHYKEDSDDTDSELDEAGGEDDSSEDGAESEEGAED